MHLYEGTLAERARMTFEHAILIRATPEALFVLTQDYTRRLAWDGFLTHASLLDGATAAGVGVRAYCVATSGLAMETEYVSFTLSLVTAVKMIRGPWFLKSFAGAWRFHEEVPGHTRVSFRYHIQASPRWLAPLLTPFVAWVFARDTKQRLAALKAFVEARNVEQDTGNSV
jgi:ribosome-associated toxin RatA of RatAB toxin-antitoxin module